MTINRLEAIQVSDTTQWIRDKYQQVGGPAGFWGYPVTSESGTPDGVGRFSHFQNGSIYWTPQTGAHEVHGAIQAEWASLGWERSILGYPVTDQSVPTTDLAIPETGSAFNNFQGGTIDWTPETGAHEVGGAILARWMQLGAQNSFLGFPIGDETDNPDNQFTGAGARYSLFQGGFISWTNLTGANAHQNGTEYQFGVDQLFITTTRSPSKDTDVLSLQVSVGGATRPQL